MSVSFELRPVSANIMVDTGHSFGPGNNSG